MASGTGVTRCRAPPRPRALLTKPGHLSLVLSSLSYVGDSTVSQAPQCPSGKKTFNKLP